MSLDFKLSDLNELDLENMGSWPPAVKFVFAVIVVILVFAAGYFFMIDSKIDTLATAQQKETELRQSYRIKYASAANLELYKQQMQEMEETFSVLLKQLPATHETPGLLDDITFVGTASGLSFVSLNWEPEIEKEFYTELPIKIEVTGDYHQLGQFVSEIARLPRIVTLHDFTIKTDRDSRLRFSVVAKTYRYKDTGK